MQYNKICERMCKFLYNLMYNCHIFIKLMHFHVAMPVKLFLVFYSQQFSFNSSIYHIKMNSQYQSINLYCPLILHLWGQVLRHLCLGFTLGDVSGLSKQCHKCVTNIQKRLQTKIIKKHIKIKK